MLTALIPKYWYGSCYTSHTAGALTVRKQNYFYHLCMVQSADLWIVVDELKRKVGGWLVIHTKKIGFVAAAFCIELSTVCSGRSIQWQSIGSLQSQDFCCNCYNLIIWEHSYFLPIITTQSNDVVFDRDVDRYLIFNFLKRLGPFDCRDKVCANNFCNSGLMQSAVCLSESFNVKFLSLWMWSCTN